jgi:hypothetical protein
MSIEFLAGRFPVSRNALACSGVKPFFAFELVLLDGSGTAYALPFGPATIQGLEAFVVAGGIGVFGAAAMSLNDILLSTVNEILLSTVFEELLTLVSVVVFGLAMRLVFESVHDWTIFSI